jgi:Spy/CpxP family protein refolding chaperone
MKLRLLSIVALCVSVTASAQTSRPAGEEEPNTVRLHEGGAAEYKVLETLGLTPEQKQQADAKVAERATQLKAWVDSDKGRELIALREQLAAARREKQSDKVAPLRKQIDPLADEYMALRAKTRLEILRVLTPEQLARYAGRALRARALGRLGNPELTEAQSQQIDTITAEAAAERLKTHPLEGDPYFRSFEAVTPATVAAIKKQVLGGADRPSKGAATRSGTSTQPAE